ncbi:MAG: FHA domain-containing protein [Myxococcaceae bacterium]|nr:FHA domain-containing protein [Myxococcaceae bacterium]
MKAIGFGQLAKQRLLLGERFVVRYPNYWLVWEPGTFVVPRGNASASDTVLPKAGRPAAPAAADPLCFVLEVTPHPVRIGRAEGNELVLSDETISRHHCELTHATDGWSLTCLDDAHSTLTLQGKPVAPGATVALAGGAKLQLGSINLTFLSPWGMASRLST